MTRRTLLLTVLAIGLWTGFAEAQTDMGFALVPKVGDGSYTNPFRPKYTRLGELGTGLDLTGSIVGLDYGAEPIFLLRVTLSVDQRTALQSMPDTMVLPADLSATVSALALPTIHAKLEAANLPADFISTALTYRQVLRRFRPVLTLMARWYEFQYPRLFATGITLDTRLNELTALQRQRLASVSDSFGLDRSGLTTTMPLRQALLLLADQLPGIPAMDGD